MSRQGGLETKQGACGGAVKDGLLLVYKPGGMTSKDVSRWFQSRFGKCKIGHVGTLDPLAEGLLPILLGKATRLQDFLLAGQKRYEFEITFGYSTTTLDTDGELVDHASYAEVSKESLEIVCSQMVGDFLQIPPMYSAIKFEGRPLYDYARKGQADKVPLESLKKLVKIFELTCLNYDQGKGRFQVLCSKGTYVRVLASTIAETLGTLGTISRLIRLASGSFESKGAWTLNELELNKDSIDQYIIPTNEIPYDIPVWRASEPALVDRLKMGQEMHVDMRSFESGLDQAGSQRAKISSLDRMILFDNNGQSFGIGSATILNTGRIAVRMRRGLS